jgi:hypothetical protein
MTNYDTLLFTCLDREEARRRVQLKINGMIASWKKLAACSISLPVKIGGPLP